MRLYNSQSRLKEDFKTIMPNKVLLYVCGITPNNATHLGHAFTYVFFDVLVRYLRHKGFDVNYLQNVTDINDGDDVIAQAQKTGRSWNQEAEYWVDHFHQQMDALNVVHPNQFIFATSIVDKIINTNSELIKKGYAYEKSGNVYFDIDTFPRYGELSRYTKEQMLHISKDRGNNPDDPDKKNPLDFVLWFKSEDDPAWDSPWGRGRPGWHIECSTMINNLLGSQIDIHGGGRDLIYPHHESEIAQSESYTGKVPFVNTWMHTSMVLCEGEKMSKSLGNLVLANDLLKKFSPNAIRWMLLSHHYRSPWEYEEFELKQDEVKVSNILKASFRISDNYDLENIKKFEHIMDDDLNTPSVLKYIEKLVEDNKIKEARQILDILGFTFE
ncbi:MAG: cysteine--tRNA ligase, partial [Candidatus Levybacteria bacterium]|nr:cysteine--tRNA ligase [Candidatus Levybacteria bacterium]